MALNINGTTGISGVDGSNASPAIQGSDSNTGLSFGTDTVNINTGGSTRATVDSNGRLGIGKTDPSYPLVARRTDASGIVAEFANSSGYGLMIGQNSATGEAYLRSGTGQPLAFVTNGGSGLARWKSGCNGFIGLSADGRNDCCTLFGKYAGESFGGDCRFVGFSIGALSFKGRAACGLVCA